VKTRNCCQDQKHTHASRNIHVRGKTTIIFFKKQQRHNWTCFKFLKYQTLLDCGMQILAKDFGCMITSVSAAKTHSQVPGPDDGEAPEDGP
jgi:hypothetical protein